MYENKEITLKEPFAVFRKLLASILGFGVLLTSTHSALLPIQKHDISPTDLKSKAISELHIHIDDSPLQHKNILLDPRYLRSVRSEGDKLAENDSKRGNWDVYQV